MIKIYQSKKYIFRLILPSLKVKKNFLINLSNKSYSLRSFTNFFKVNLTANSSQAKLKRKLYKYKDNTTIL